MNFKRFAYLVLMLIHSIALITCTGKSDDSSGSFPETCAEVQESAEDETGSRPDNGTYTLYVDGDETMPWEAYCHDMKRSEPKEFISVNEPDNYSEVTTPGGVAQTTYRRYRINPLTLEIDLLDDTFADTNDHNIDHGMPDDREHIPVGWAQFGTYSEDGSGTAEAQIDLTDTGFALDADLENDDYFCTISDGGDTDGSDVDITADLLILTLTATNGTASELTKTVADCDHFGAEDNPGDDEDFTEGTLPLQYVGSSN